MPLTLPQQRTFETVLAELNELTDEQARDPRTLIALAVTIGVTAGQESRSTEWVTVNALSKRYNCHPSTVENALFAANVRPKLHGKRLKYRLKDADLAWQSYGNR